MTDTLEVSDDSSELAEKLDQDIEQFMAKMKPSRYTDGWKEETWREEMEQHPFFMTKQPEGDNLPPLLEGLQQLKYDENINTPEEIASTYKDEGNINFKAKNYHKAIINYTEGLKEKCSNDLRSQLYNNRAAAHYYLKNYSSAFKDSENAVRYKEGKNYLKAEIRSIQCLYRLRRYEDCILQADAFKTRHGDNEEIAKILKDSFMKDKEEKRNSRKRKNFEIKRKLEEDKIINAIKERKIKLNLVTEDGLPEQLTSLEQLKPQYERLRGEGVKLVSENVLAWPVQFVYPEYHILECSTCCREDIPLRDILGEMLSSRAEWDAMGKYTIDNSNLRISTVLDSAYKHVSLDDCLKNLYTRNGFSVSGGVPSFVVVLAGTEEEKRLLSTTPTSGIPDPLATSDPMDFTSEQEE